jgi:hypothetical protein
MSKRISSKETLAKLMATENIFVEHANVPTAGFDLINRRLLLPNWKNISDDVYTLLISHEVGHALFTPKDEWEDAVSKEKNAAYKQVVNIVEDVRIEKMIQQKYPGTARAFRSGYDELCQSNLFGTKNKKIEDYGLLDRLNLHFKLGHYGYAKIPFSDDERKWIDRVSNCKTFSDVLSVAADLKQYVEQNPESQGKNGDSSQMTEDYNSETSEISQPSENQSRQSSGAPNTSGERSAQTRLGETDSNNMAQSSPHANRGDPDADGTDNGSATNSRIEKKEPVLSETQEHFDSAIQGLVDKTVTDIRYANLPDIQLDKLIVPYKVVHDQISNYYANYYIKTYESAATQVEQFRSSSKNVVNQLANLFEMKKKARLDVKALVAKTGKLDMNRVHTYRYNDDVFKKITTIPQGKSHGLIMFIDMSSSMADNLSGTFEQLLNLVLFCKRVNIPYDVYGFTDSYSARRNMPAHPTKQGTLFFEPNFCLRHYFSSKMTGAEFNKALQNVVCLMRYHSGQTLGGLPSEEALNTTPLVPAIMTAIPLVKNFRREYGLDIVNTVFLTDGDDTHGLMYHDENGDVKYFPCERYGSYSRTKDRHFIRDLKTRNQWEIKSITSDLLNILREEAGVKTIGFHIIKKRDVGYLITRHTQNVKDEEKHLDNFKNHKFAELTKIPGYDAYYLIPSGTNLSLNDDEFSSDVDTTVDWEDEKQAKKAMRAVQKNFSNFMKQRVVSRILLNRFIDHIS